MKYTVVLTGPILQEGLDLLLARKDITLVQAPDWSEKIAARLLPTAHAILVRTHPLPRTLLAQAPVLRVVSRFGVGVDNVDWRYLSERDIPLCVTTGANADSVAEQTLLFMLAMAKDLHSAQAAVCEGKWTWREQHSAQELRGKTALLIGFGNIGRAVATLCSAFGMHVIAWSRSEQTNLPPNVTMTKDFRAHLPEADFISLHLPHTPETHHLLSLDDMTRLKPGACIVNTGRGSLLDERVLLHALESGLLGGVGLDVFEHEPPDLHSPLLQHPRSFFTPHNAGLTHECMTRMSVLSARNILDALDGCLNPQMIFNGKRVSSPSV